MPSAKRADEVMALGVVAGGEGMDRVTAKAPSIRPSGGSVKSMAGLRRQVALTLGSHQRLVIAPQEKRRASGRVRTRRRNSAEDRNGAGKKRSKMLCGWLVKRRDRKVPAFFVLNWGKECPFFAEPATFTSTTLAE